MLLFPSKLDSDRDLSRRFMPHQINWIQAEKALVQQGKQAIALAEKSVRIGWTYADAFKNVRKRLWFKSRDYLFATKDYASAIEYVRQCYTFAEIFNLTHAITRHGEEYIQVNRVTIVDAIQLGLVEVINRARAAHFTREQFLADCQARARDEEIFQQAYMCNPLGAATNRIVEWSAVERCRFDYQIERVHLEAEQVRRQFGEFSPSSEAARANQIDQFIIRPATVTSPGLGPSPPQPISTADPVVSGQPFSWRTELSIPVAASGRKSSPTQPECF